MIHVAYGKIGEQIIKALRKTKKSTQYVLNFICIQFASHSKIIKNNFYIESLKSRQNILSQELK